MPFPAADVLPCPPPGLDARLVAKVVAMTAESDRVVVAIVRELPNPREPGKTFTTTWFEMWRIKNGKADEHWDHGTIGPPAPPGAGVPAGRGQ